MNSPQANESAGGLHRGLGLLPATALNVTNMVGAGPFITISLFVAEMHGPQALIAWVIAAVLVLCDGLVWSELGAALPGSGGSYHFLSAIFGRYRWGRIIPFLFIWQFLVSGTLETASGYIGGVNYLTYAFPNLEATLAAWHIPGGMATLAATFVMLITLSLCRPIGSLGWFSVILFAGALVTVLTVIVVGVSNFDARLLEMPANAFSFDRPFFNGLGAAMLIAIYDYLGYYNVCHLGDEVKDPGKTIPRAVMISVAIVAVLYLTMNIAILGVIPWQEVEKSEFVASLLMERIFDRDVAVAFTALILWTILACVFAQTLGYSRIPYAAARNGDFFRVFARLHRRDRYPIVSLGALGLLTATFCYLPLGSLIEGAVTVRIVVQFIGQIAGLHLLRKTRPDVRLPFRMWLYPLPSLIALAGWIFVLATAKLVTLAIAAGVFVSGCLAFLVWSSCRQDVYRNLISGQSPGIFPGMLRLSLYAFSWFYGAAVRCRTAMYDAGWLRAESMPIPVVSLGNLTTGGTGKTPFAAFVARWYLDRGVRACLLSRGYGSEEGTTNDEALVLQQLCPDLPHLQNPDRVASARMAVAELQCQLLILDDGFQHRRLARDLDIVLVDATNPWGYGHLLPNGLLREPVDALRRAALVVITRVDQASGVQVAEIRERVAAVHPGCEIVEVAFPPEKLLNSSGATAALGSLRKLRVAAFCGIGNPRAFHDSLASMRLDVVSFQAFPDHHPYSEETIERLREWAAAQDVVAVITTQKDLVKIRQDRLGDLPLWAVQIGTQVTSGGELLERRLRDLLDRAGRDDLLK